MRRLIALAASFVLTLCSWALLVADSSDGVCGVLPEVSVTYDYATDCMGTATSGRIHLSQPGRRGELDPAGDAGRSYLANKEGCSYELLSEQVKTSLVAAGLNVHEAYLAWDVADCHLHEGTATPRGFVMVVYGEPAGTGTAAPDVPIYRCEQPAGGLAADASITCAALGWETAVDGSGAYTPGAPIEDGGTCQLTLTFISD